VKLKETIKQLIFSADDYSYQGIEEKKKSILLNLFFNFYFLVIVGFFIFNLLIGNKIFLMVTAAGMALGLFLYYFFKAKGNLYPVAGIFVAMIILLVGFFILTGGVGNTGLIFSLLVPVPVILLLGRKKGLFVLGGFLAINTCIFLFARGSDWFPAYDLRMVIRTAIVFVLIALTAYANEYVFGVLYQGHEKLSASLKVSQQRYKNLAVNREKFVSLVSQSLTDHVSRFVVAATLLNDEYNTLTDSRRKQIIRSLANIARQNQKLIGDLQKWATVRSDTIPFSPKPIKLEKIYREVVDLYNPLIEEKKLSFFLKMKSNSEVFADESMVSAILRGLVSNAIKFSFPGGEVRVSAKEQDDKMVITVSDNGTGMSEEDRIRINASFSFSTEGTLLEPGSGIGLILVKEFLQKHQSDLHVESHKGEGTAVSFSLPLTD
jgi:signal transduction histidine kinase